MLLGGTEVNCIVGLLRASRGLPSLTLLLAPLTVLCVSWFSASLVLAYKVLLDAPHCLLLRFGLSLQPHVTGWQ